MRFGVVSLKVGGQRQGTYVSCVRTLLGWTAGLIALLFVTMAANAAPVLPQGGQFVAGAGSILPNGATGLQINQLGARGVIDWRGFSIGSGGSVSINNGSGATLNRVTGGQASQIDGQLTATGSAYLINPQGVVVGPTGR